MKDGHTIILWRLLYAVTIAAAVAACAGQPRAAREGAVTVARIERASWDAPPETGLFRVVFAEQLSRDIRQQAETTRTQEAMDDYYAEIRALEREAEIELKARGLCNANVKFLRSLDEGGGRATMGAIFKCRPSLF